MCFILTDGHPITLAQVSTLRRPFYHSGQVIHHPTTYSGSNRKENLCVEIDCRALKKIHFSKGVPGVFLIVGFEKAYNVSRILTFLTS